jgi:hypothetical protein
MGGSAPSYQHEVAPSNGNFTLSNLRATRTIYVGQYGLVTVNDTILVANNGSNTATSWTFYLPQDAYSDLTYLAAYGNLTKLDVLRAPSVASFVGMEVNFASIGGLPADGMLIVTVIQQYSGLCKTTWNSVEVNLWFYRYVVSPYTTANYNTTVVLPPEASTLENSSMYTSLVPPFNCTRLSFATTGSYDYTPSFPLIEVSVNRRVEVTPDGYLVTTETHHIVNLGPGTISAINFSVPTSVLPGSLAASDSSGPLTCSANGSSVSVNFQYAVQQNWTYTYQISYRSSLGDYTASVNGMTDLKMSPITSFNGTIDSETFSLVLSPHAVLNNASRSAQALGLEGDQITATYTFQNVTYLNTSPLEFRYSDDLAETFERPIFFTFLIFVIGLIYVSIRKVMPKSARAAAVKEEEEKTRGLTTTLKEFCSNYEEKTALMLEVEKLAEDRRKGRLSKRAYLEQLDHDRRRIASLTNSINEAKKKLIPANKRYATMIRQLETLEEERENAKASLDNLELRRRQGKVSGDVYNRLKFENTRKIEKSTASIDSVVTQLRQETL